MRAGAEIAGTRHAAEGLLLSATLLALVLINLQFWGIDTPPLIDWPNHLARHVLQCGAPGAEHIGRYYAYDLELVPNLASDLIHTLPIACADPGVTQKLLIQVSSVGVLFSTVILHRAIWGSYSVWPVISGLIMHHMAWAYGFENFVLSVPFALLILAVWFFLAGRSAVTRLLVLWPMVCGLYVFHLYAFGFLFLTIAALELDRLFAHGKAWPRPRAAFVTVGLLALIAAFPAVHTLAALRASPEVQTTLYGYGGYRTLLMTLLSPFAGFGNPLQSREELAAAVAAMLAFLLIGLGAGKYSDTMQLDPRVRRILPVLCLATLVAPISFSGVFFSNIRFPVMLAAILIAALRFDMPARVAWAFSIAVLVAVAAKSGWIASKWTLHETQVAELRQASGGLAPSDRLLVVRDARTPPVVFHSHSTSYLVRDRGVYWMGLFTGGNSLSPRPEYAQRDHTQPFPFNWRVLGPQYQDMPAFAEGGLLNDWSSFYTHALLLFDPSGNRPDASPLGEVEAAGSFFTIYRIEPAAPGDWP